MLKIAEAPLRFQVGHTCSGLDANECECMSQESHTEVMPPFNVGSLFCYTCTWPNFMSKFSLVQALPPDSSTSLLLGPLIHFACILIYVSVEGLASPGIACMLPGHVCPELPDHDHAMHAQVPSRHTCWPTMNATEGCMLSSVSDKLDLMHDVIRPFAFWNFSCMVHACFHGCHHGKAAKRWTLSSSRPA